MDFHEGTISASNERKNQRPPSERSAPPGPIDSCSFLGLPKERAAPTEVVASFDGPPQGNKVK